MQNDRALSEEQLQKMEQDRKKKLAKEVTADFENRREDRRKVENGWILNMNFLSGNQFSTMTEDGLLQDDDRQFYWQSRKAFNHIAPMVDSRLAKLTKLRPLVKARAFSDEERDVQSAKLATGILSYVRQKIDFDHTVTRATLWAETCGSAFYKIVWNEKGGKKVALDESGKAVYEGEVGITAISPFEIFPDRLDAEGLEDVKSVIYAKVVPVDYIYEQFGVVVKGRDLSDCTLAPYSENYASKSPMEATFSERTKHADSEILIERYTRPSGENKDGRLEIVAGGELLYEGDLPYVNGEKDTRGFPFVQQDCVRLPGAFFGSSLIDRLIPVQRAYNTVRNRKHELLNRVATGVLTVEDGSVDTDELAEEGICPGKVLIYRQGGKAPELLEYGKVPEDFKSEEEWLEKEFTLISGVSDLTKNSLPQTVTSATGLKLLLAEDETRLSVTIKNIGNAMKETAQHILRLYRQFAGNARLMTVTGENKKTEIYYFNASDLDEGDIILETEQAENAEERKETILRLLEAGVLTDADGKIPSDIRHRILDAFGFGSFENAKDISSLHIVKAQEENLDLMKNYVEIDSYDDHGLHVLEHTRYLLSEEFKRKATPLIKERFENHIAEHEKRKHSF